MKHPIFRQEFGGEPYQCGVMDYSATEWSKNPLNRSYPWPGGFKPGDVATSGSGINSGGRVIVVSWHTEFGDPQPGLVPAFDPKFDGTYYWWFAPQFLKRA
jgi:hypothetical protein